MKKEEILEAIQSLAEAIEADNFEDKNKWICHALKDLSRALED